ncbi:Uncharacterised protein [Mycobacteroides abscessus subsp. massiliense]|uniref:hypothetical protein n=1 Tax=Mycobacteroides abscessus TaxID=36809 RepID=UPI00092CB36D|nr:hypothetical protein [Mycobacteroides abscessus]SHR63569.1 Uncharacterised protein [Mycobacteroides abscessus subsp. abscessus]SKG49115.1 Uncharacterised protein [Mycobacteroides abscessus subsp. massiliense]SKH00622.1 Uncharacterised protein [Mycobacteroides abscessus subsp. massiliense]SKH98126.1 Uncharacterised protein [Mycobacteroides abscessus subsp. massiliense]SKJ26935.1 Uncharacterised protein [Mycobacteroides abscessus subsp. massiliense]
MTQTVVQMQNVMDSAQREELIPVSIPWGTSLVMGDVDSWLPHMTQPAPLGGVPVKIRLATEDESAHGVDGYVLFRVPRRDR